MLEVRGLRAGYGPVEILTGVDLVVGKGEVVTLLGANGAGKSTLINNATGIFKAFGGSVFFDGRDITNSSAGEVVSLGLIQVPEGRRVFPNLTVRENLELGSYRRGTKNRATNYDRIISMFPRLRERKSQRAGTLSGGEQQMLAIGRGLMAEPKLLILDEPSLGLSPLLVDEIFKLIPVLVSSGIGVLLVEQNVMQSLNVAKRAYVLENGRMVIEGPAHEIADNADLRRSYLGL
jgi:branched-chain amino acid transport system ATP-binding protein